jgi:hypothetical protein
MRYRRLEVKCEFEKNTKVEVTIGNLAASKGRPQPQRRIGAGLRYGRWPQFQK